LILFRLQYDGYDAVSDSIGIFWGRRVGMVLAELVDHVVQRHTVEHYAVYGSIRCSEQSQDFEADDWYM